MTQASMLYHYIHTYMKMQDIMTDQQIHGQFHPLHVQHPMYSHVVTSIALSCQEMKCFEGKHSVSSHVHVV